MSTNTTQLDTAQRNLIRLMQANAKEPLDVADACNCTPQLVYRWMNGTRKITDSKIKLLATLFGVSESYMKYGSPEVDTDALGEVAAGVIDALKENGVLSTEASPQQIGSLIAMVFADYEAYGAPDEDRIRQYIKLITPGATGSGPASSRLKQ